MMKRTKIVAAVAALVSSLFLPQTARAAEPFYTHDITSAKVILKAENEPNGCPGHRITGGSSSQNANNILVESGYHKIILSDVTIDASQVSNLGAFIINPECKVDLTLEGNSKLIGSATTAGIHVPSSAVLNIMKESDGASLEVTGGAGAAGIGGQGLTGHAGEIHIYGGNVTAKGGAGAAGIGGSGEGGAGNITINGGVVKATGGNAKQGEKGAAGIGCGNLCKSIKEKGGNVAINDGKVTATAGKNGTDITTPVYGIDCAKLTSKYGKELVVHTTISSNVDKSQFNGIVWTDADTCYVYGDAIVNKNSFQLGAGKVMVLAPQNSLTIPEGWKIEGKIVPKLNNEDKSVPGGTIVNMHYSDASNSDKFIGTFGRTVTLTVNDFENVVTAEYSGNNLFDSLVQYKSDRTIGTEVYGIDRKGWTAVVNRGSGTPFIKDVGKYSVTFNHPVHPSFTLPERTVTPYDIKQIGVKTEFGTYSAVYTGQPIVPPITLKHNNNKDTMQEGKDYQKPIYTDNINVGTAKIAIHGIGNFKGTREVTFKIQPASIETAKLELNKETGKTNYLYNGKVQQPTITVTLGDKVLDPATEYDVKFLKADGKTEANCIDAGTVTVQVKGKGNYTGTLEEKYQIETVQLPVLTATAENRAYDATDQVKILYVGLDMANVIATDKDQVEAPVGMLATVESPNVGSYKSVKFENAVCGGPRGANYTAVVAGEGVTLTEPVVISKKAGVKAPKVTVDYQESLNPDYKNKFVCTVKVDPQGDNYEYCIDDTSGTWTSSRIFDGLLPGSEHTFYARVKESANTQAGTPGEAKVVLEKLDRPAPEPFEMIFTRNVGEATFTAEIPYVQGAYYAFSEGNKENISDAEFTTDNKKTDCKPSTEYTGYIKFMADETHKASDITKHTKRTPSLKVAAPQISPEGGLFLSNTEISITCETEGAEIYYTTDAKATPTAASTKYEKPFKIDKTTTVRAIAVKPGMEDSLVTEVVYKKADNKNIFSDVEILEGEDKFVITDDLKAAGFGTGAEEKSIAQQLSLILTEMGYNWNEIAYYDVKLKVGIKDGDSEIRWQDATVDNFPLDKNGKGSLTVTMPYPKGTDKATHDYAVCHMFAETSERLGTKAGETEQPKVSETEDGLQFTLTSTSPIAIAWKKVKDAITNPDGTKPNDTKPNDGTQDGTNPDGTNPDGTNPNGTTQDGTNPDGTNPDGTNADGTNPDGTNSNGTNADGTNGNATNSDGTNADKTATGLKSLFSPKTGDSTWIIAWAVVLLAAAGAIAVILKKRK